MSSVQHTTVQIPADADALLEAKLRQADLDIEQYQSRNKSKLWNAYHSVAQYLWCSCFDCEDRKEAKKAAKELARQNELLKKWLHGCHTRGELFLYNAEGKPTPTNSLDLRFS